VAAVSRRAAFVRRLLPLLALAVAAAWFFQDTPADRVLVYDLAGRPGITALRVDLRRVSDGALERHVEYRYSDRVPAPPQQRQAVRLAPGAYRAEIALDFGPRSEVVERVFTLTGESELILRP